MNSSIANSTVTRIEFAEMHGWSPSYVTKLAKAKRLVLTEDGRRVDVAASEQLLRETASVDKQGLREYHARRRKRPPLPLVVSLPDDAPDITSYNAARARREAALAALAEMDRCRREAQLVEVAEVRKAVKLIARVIASYLDHVHARIAALWATEQTPEARERLFIDELRAIRNELADNVQRLFEPQQEAT